MNKRLRFIFLVLIAVVLTASFAVAQGGTGNGGAKKNNLIGLPVEEGGGVFLDMHAIGTQNEVASGSTNTDVASASEFKLDQNAIFGEHPSIDKNTPGEGKNLADYHTFLAGTENETFLFFGGMRGNADIMNSETGVKAISENIAGALPVYLSAVAFTEPAMHDSITESMAYSQRLVGQLYEHERHFLSQLETRPLMKRYVQDQLQACLHDKVAEGIPWVRAQTECLGDSILKSEKDFKANPQDGDHFVEHLAGKEVDKHIESEKKMIIPTTVVGWLFDKAIEDSKQIAFVPFFGPLNMNYQVTQRMEAGKKMWLKWLGDYTVKLGKVDTNMKKKGGVHLAVKTAPVKDDMDKRITQLEVLNNIAEKRFESMMELLKHRCEHKFAKPPAVSTSNLTAEDKLYELKDKQQGDNVGDANKIAIPGWIIDIAELDALLAVFTHATKQDDKGKPDCNELKKDHFRKYNSGTSAGDSTTWAKKFNTLAYLHAGVYRLHILGGMLQMVDMRAVGDGLRDSANAQLAVQMVMHATGFNHPQEGLQVIYGKLQEFWAGIFEEVDKINNDNNSSLSNADDQAEGGN